MDFINSKDEQKTEFLTRFLSCEKKVDTLTSPGRIGDPSFYAPTFTPNRVKLENPNFRFEIAFGDVNSAVI